MRIFGVDSTRGTTWIFRNSRPDRISGIGWDIRHWTKTHFRRLGSNGAWFWLASERLISLASDYRIGSYA